MRKLSWVLLGLAVVPAPLLASDGVLEINQDCVDSGCFPGDSAGFPVTLAAGGAYRLTSNLSVDTAANGIQIQAGNTFDLDLGGFTIDGGGSCTGTPVTTCTAGNGLNGVAMTGLSKVHLHDGSVRGFSSSNVLLTQLEDGSSLDNLTISEATGTSFAGLSLSASNRTIVVRNVTLSRNRGIGLVASGSNAHYVIDGLVVSNNGANGANLNSSATIRDASFYRNSGFGLQSTQVIALGNTSFFGNNGGSTAAQFSITTLLNMGGVVCEDASCP